ncbi:hypothetical protein HDE_00121 [Halotydeus destructor]|nr:hypothetical protein HDE_00121 [Halotydeus destructor]
MNLGKVRGIVCEKKSTKSFKQVSANITKHKNYNHFQRRESDARWRASLANTINVLKNTTANEHYADRKQSRHAILDHAHNRIESQENNIRGRAHSLGLNGSLAVQRLRDYFAKSENERTRAEPHYHKRTKRENSSQSSFGEPESVAPIRIKEEPFDMEPVYIDGIKIEPLYRETNTVSSGYFSQNYYSNDSNGSNAIEADPYAHVPFLQGIILNDEAMKGCDFYDNDNQPFTTNAGGDVLYNALPDMSFEENKMVNMTHEDPIITGSDRWAEDGSNTYTDLLPQNPSRF